MTTTAHRARRSLMLASGIAVAALALAGCSADDAAAPSSSSAAGSSDLAKAVAAAEALPTSYPIPADPISGVSALKGKTVYYIPITQQAPQFTVTGTALKKALGTVGITVQTCDGKGTPTDIGACIGQAQGAGAAGIILDAIPYELAANGLDAARAAGIPVIVSDQGPTDDKYPADATLAYLPAPAPATDTALLQWIAKDSGGKANILINQDADGPWPAAYMKTALAQLKKDCPDCKTTINQVSSANFAQVAPSTSAALLADPSIDYVFTDFAQFLQPTQGGIQSAGVADTVKVVSGAAVLGTYQAVKAGQLAAAAGQAASFQGWQAGDIILRLITKTKVGDYAIPTRLFSPTNIDSVTLTAAAEASGEWFGPTTFPADFKKLWSAE
ncbi:hypothetical protein ASE16_00630 [Leifsonia sp. Root227]|uniref:sugar ABC transporter substrate-binding protein n=1 Tax=Leifsonia sp. Root227 TaxID=1736496 RepID=UPI0006F50C02|nr:substrate-binding domain-containing protein [Leifsonia sp. Root227]KRC51637.1 hypothetical protein ASE16_00630 [Leifsonia sp. Root227]